jgi:hypothetical protein
MAEELKFYSFSRSQAASTGERAADGRLQGKLELTLRDLRGTPRASGEIPYLLMGPRDVSGLKPGAVRRTYPVNGAFDVETDKCPYAEFAAEDLPWRYSSDPNGDELKPWLLLVVGTPEEVILLPGSRVKLSQNLVTAYGPASLSAKVKLWAHAQEHEGRIVSRLLSPRELEKSQSYIAVIVPAFDDEVRVRLPAGQAIPTYYTWRFTTSETEGSFVNLAKRLEPFKPTANMGMAAVAYQTGANQAMVHPEMRVGGALVGPASVPPPPLLDDHGVRDHFSAIRPRPVGAAQPDEARPPIVQLPRYGEPWLEPDQDEPAWMQELNDDPRHRGVAGLGLWAAIEWQDRIVEAAAKQLGAFYTASRRIRQLTLGLAATRSLWEHRLPVDDMHRLQVLGLAMARLETPQGGSVLDHVTVTARPLPPALFSSAARRLLRPGTARARLANAGALAPGALFERMNTCPPEDSEHPHGLAHVDLIIGENLDEEIGVRLRRGAGYRVSDDVSPQAQILHDEETINRAETGLEEDASWPMAVQHLREQEHDDQLALLETLYAPIPVRPCQEERSRANLPRLSEVLGDAFDPRGDQAFVIRRVLATLQGLDDQPLTPPELCMDFNIPAWKFLKEYAQDWFLPGLDQLEFEVLDENGQPAPDLERDPVVAAQTNPQFSDAFLVGFNQQALAELRWRNVPLAAGCTPLRRFWEPIASSEASEDIAGIHGWQSDTALGDPQHKTPAAQGENAQGAYLVLIFKSQLWRRYPETLIYLLPEKADRERTPNWEAEHIQPNLHVEVEPDVVAFGFDRSATILEAHWVVIEQVPRGLTFYNLNKPKGEQANQKDNGALFATAAFALPVRVLIRGKELIVPA